MTQPAPNSNYTPDEIQAVVQKLVLSTITRSYDTLGVRRTDLTFNDIQQAAAGVFILFPNSPFYVLQLGMKRVQDLITSEAAILDQLLAAVAVIGRPLLPVADVSPLFNVQSALQNLGSAAVSRAGVFTDITKTPAYQQLSANTQAFLSGPAGQAVKQNGAIVQTPQQAVAAIPALMSQLAAAHANLVATVTGLVGGIDNYNALNLPSVVISSVLANGAALVGADAAALSSLTPTQRLASIRSVILNLLATKAVVDKFGIFSGPSDYYTLAGLGTPYSDAQHLATPALVQSDKSGGYAIVFGVTDDLHVTADGAAPFDILLNTSLVAEIDGQADDSNFIIGDGTHPFMGATNAIPNNNKFKVKVGGVSYVATLTDSADASTASITGTGDTTTAGWYGGGGALDGATLAILLDGVANRLVTFVAPANAGAMVNQINAVLQATPHGALASIVANRLVLTTLNAGQGVSITAEHVFSGPANPVLGFTDGQTASGAVFPRTADQVAANIQAVLPAGAAAEAYYAPLHFSGLMDIPAGTNQTWVLHLVGSSDLVALGVTTSDTANVLSGPNAGQRFPITAVTSSSITVTGVSVAQLSANLEIGAKNRRVKLLLTNPAVQVPAETVLQVYADDAPSTAALLTLGFTAGVSSQSQLTTADQVATDINSKTAVLTAGTAITTTNGPLTTAHADVLNLNHVVFMAAAAAGTTAFTGTQVTFTVTSLTTAGPVSAGDTLALRDGPSPAHGYTIATINGLTPVDHALVVGDVVVAHGSFAGTGGAGVNVEFGPTLLIQKYRVVTITGGPNAGNYFVSGTGDTAIDVLLIRALSVVRSLSSPTTGYITMTASLGDMYLTLASKNTTTLSSLVLAGDAAPLFFTSPPRTQLGTSQWFQLPAIPDGLQAGDILEYYPTDYNNPSFSYIIQQVIASLRVIQVGLDSGSSAYVPDGASWQFSPQPVPFARLHFGIKNDFGFTQGLLETWLALPENQALYLQNLNAKINPILVNSNPTAAQVGDAAAGLNTLYQFLTTAKAQALLGDPAVALQAILQTFTVEPVPAVDTLIQSFTQKGSDLAVDILLKGQFSSFFGLTVDGASYSGAMQAATRAVAMNDLPVRKINRSNVQSSQLISQSQSPDLEYPANLAAETIPGAQVDPPTSYGEPSNYGTTSGSQGSGNQ